MCGRFFLSDSETVDILEDAIAELQRKKPVKTGEICPSDTAAVIANSRTLKPSCFAMSWGYRLGEGRLLINARSETAEEKSVFADGMRQRRCLIPASHYFEWERRGSQKIKYAICPERSGLTWLAGIYRLEQSGPVFTILTREPAESIRFIHDRMPVILPREVHEAWLNPKYAAKEILREAVTRVQFAPIQ